MCIHVISTSNFSHLGGGSSLVVRAQDDDLDEDVVEGEEDMDATVETEPEDGVGSDGVLSDTPQVCFLYC